MVCDHGQVRWIALSLLLVAAACARKPDPLVELAPYMPANSVMVAGLDVEKLRNTPLYAKLPESFREASYVLAAYSPPNLVTASRVGGRVVATGPIVNAPPSILGHAADTPIWVVARGDAQLPLTGNLANVTRLLQQTDYTRVTARVGERVEFAAEGVCPSQQAAEHLEQNVRGIASLAKLPLQVRRDGLTVHVTGSATAEAVSRLF
jgi:hypothetical protein